MDSWDFSNTLPHSVKRPSLAPSDETPHTTEPVFELDEERAAAKGQPRDDSEKSEESSSGPPTPGPTTPVLLGLSSPPKNNPKIQVLSVSPGESPNSRMNYNTPSVPIPTRATHAKSSSRSIPDPSTDLNDAAVVVPRSAPPDKSSQSSRLWNKLTNRGSIRGKKLNAALEKTDTLARVVSAGFSSKSYRS